MSITAVALAKWGIPIALEMGHSWLQSRDIKKAQKKAEKENKRSQAMSNLINALSPSSQHQAYRTEAEYRPSGLTRALGAAKLGYGAYTGLKGAIAKEAMQKGAQELQDLAIGSAKRGAGKEVGQEYAAKAIRQAKAAGIKPGTEDWNRVTGLISRFGGDREGFGAGAMGALQEYEDTGLNRQALQAQIGRTIGKDRYARETMAADRAGADLGRKAPAFTPSDGLEHFLIEPPEGEGIVTAAREPFGLGEAAGFMGAGEADRTSGLRERLLEAQVEDLEDPDVDANVDLASRYVNDPDGFRGLPNTVKAKILPLLPGLGADIKKFTGRDMSDKQLMKVSSAKDLQEALKRFYQLVDTNKDVIGKGVAISPDARRKVALIQSEAKKLGRFAARAAEPGVLSNEDVAAYEALFPDKWDSWNYAQQLLIQRMEELEANGPRFIAGVRQAGFYVPQNFEVEDNITGLWRERYNRSGGN